MTQVLAQLDALESEVILITPTIYDQTAELERANNYGANDALGACADFLEETATARGQGVVDFYDTMKVINAELQRDDPSATIVGKDRVHPDWDPGHFVMAYQFLKAQGVPALVSRVVMDVRQGKVLAAEQATVTGIDSKPGVFTFTVLEAALPFPQTDSIAKGLSIVPFEAEMNQQMLVIQRLPKGNFTLTIDGIAVGTWSAEAFKAGINLAWVERPHRSTSAERQRT